MGTDEKQDKDEKTLVRDLIMNDELGEKILEVAAECHDTVTNHLALLFDEMRMNVLSAKATNLYLAQRFAYYFPHSEWSPDPSTPYPHLFHRGTSTHLNVRAAAPWTGGTPSGGATMRAKARYHQGAAMSASQIACLPHTFNGMPDLSSITLMLVCDYNKIGGDFIYACKPTESGKAGLRVPTAYSFPITRGGTMPQDPGSFTPDPPDQSFLTDLLPEDDEEKTSTAPQQNRA